MNMMVRIKSLWFWVAMIPAVLLFVQLVAAIFGITLDFQVLQGQLLAVINAAFGILVILGVAVDTTTPGIKDSELTMLKSEPTAFSEKEACSVLQAENE